MTIDVVNTSSVLNQNNLLNPDLELKNLPVLVLKCVQFYLVFGNPNYAIHSKSQKHNFFNIKHFIFQMAEKHGMQFNETSAKDNMNIEKAFQDIANAIVFTVREYLIMIFLLQPVFNVQIFTTDQFQ